MGAEIKVYSVALLNCLTPRCVRYILASGFQTRGKISLHSFTVAPLGTIYWLITSILCPLELFFSLVFSYWFRKHQQVCYIML